MPVGANANGDSGGVALLLDARLASVYPLSQMFVDSAAVGEADFVRDKLLGNGKFGVAWCVRRRYFPTGARRALARARCVFHRWTLLLPRQARDARALGHGVRAQGGCKSGHY